MWVLCKNSCQGFDSPFDEAKCVETLTTILEYSTHEIDIVILILNAW